MAAEETDFSPQNKAEKWEICVAHPLLLAASGSIRSALDPVADAHRMISPEPQILGEFGIIGKLGQGGMGAVHKARQSSLGGLVALKVLPASMGNDEEHHPLQSGGALGGL
jgi:hypothetical protein